MNKEIENAMIEEVFLGIEDHGIPAININCCMGSTRQGTGCYDIRKMDLAKALVALFTIAGVDSWDKLPGKPIRVKRQDGMIKKLGHFMEDSWMDFKDFYPKSEAANG
jgi:hypothetical protein